MSLDPELKMPDFDEPNAAKPASETAGPAPEDSLPHDRRKLRTGAAVLGALAVLAALLFSAYVTTRPADLRAYTDRLSAEVAQLFRNRHIPTLRFREQPPTVRRDDGAVWTHHEMRAELPPELSIDAVADIIRRQTALQNVQLVELPLNEADGLQLRMELRGREYATVRLRGGAAGARGGEQESRRRMAARTGMTELVRRALLEAGLPAEAIVEAHPPTRSEAPARLEARLGGVVGPSQAIDALERALESHDVRMRLAPAAAGVYVTLLEGDTRLLQVLLKRGPQSGAGDFAVTSETLEPPQEKLPAFDELPLESEDVALGAIPGPLDGSALPGADAGRPAVAIILDDGGYGGEVTERVLALDPDLTLAILPFTPHAEDTARRAAERGFEVILHMPMASAGDGDPFPGELGTGMTPGEVSAATTRALLAVPGAVGVNNHTGSRYTEDPAAMRAFLEPIAEAGLFFVDSRTTAGSVAYGVAVELGVPAAQRDLFLDNDPQPAAIASRFEELLETARSQGSAIGIGHFRPATVAALERLLPRLDEAGVRLVHVSELLGASEPD